MSGGSENGDNWNVAWVPRDGGWEGRVRLGGAECEVRVRPHAPAPGFPCCWIGLVGPRGAATACFGDDPGGLCEHVAQQGARYIEETARIVADRFGMPGRRGR